MFPFEKNELRMEIKAATQQLKVKSAQNHQIACNVYQVVHLFYYFRRSRQKKYFASEQIDIICTYMHYISLKELSSQHFLIKIPFRNPLYPRKIRFNIDIKLYNLYIIEYMKILPIYSYFLFYKNPIYGYYFYYKFIRFKS